MTAHGERFWARYAPELDFPVEEPELDIVIDRGDRGYSRDWARSLRLNALWVSYHQMYHHSWVNRIMKKAAGLQDPYAVLWVAELKALAGNAGPAFSYLSNKHRYGMNRALDNTVTGLRAGWAWRAWNSWRWGALLPSHYHTTIDELASDTARWFLVNGESDRARSVFYEVDQWGVGADHFSHANWLLEYANDPAEAQKVLEASADSEDRSARLLGEILLAEGDEAGPRELWKGVASSDYWAAKLLRQSTRRAKRRRGRRGNQTR